MLTHVAFDAKAGTLMATDSYIAAVVPCEVEPGDESGLIPTAALKAAKGESLRIADGKATLTLPDGERSWSLYVMPGGMKFPDLDIYWDKTPRLDAPFGFNPFFFQRLGAALGATKGGTPVAIHPDHPMKATLVTGVGENKDAYGLMMPIRLEGDERAPAVTVREALANDGAVLAAAEAAVAALGKKRGRKRSAEVFRKKLIEAAS